MNIPPIIQGGMGVAISNWTLAKVVAQTGQLGVISGTGLSLVITSRLADGDLSGDIRRAMSHFPVQEPIQQILDRYYVAGGKPEHAPYKTPPPYSLTPPRSLDILTVVANFVEVFLAKEGHDGMVGINLMEKLQLPNLASMYGAMLAGVDVVLMGAGIPIQIPALLDRLVDHEKVSYRVDVVGAHPDEDYRIYFDPTTLFPGIKDKTGSLKRPKFLPIISSVVLAQALLKRSQGTIDGFVIEGPTAGGHNAPPRGALTLNALGEPIYGEKDEVDLNKMAQLGLPFWLAGGRGTYQGLQEALQAGASGIQVGTLFAFCEESGMAAVLKHAIIRQVLGNQISVYTSPSASPTGFPFKVVMLDGTVADLAVYNARERICDFGFLRTLYRREDGKVGYRCPAEPVADYVRKGGLAEETANRICLCNQLGATAGFSQQRKNGAQEPAVVTSGDDLLQIQDLIQPGREEYTAQDVLAYLLHEPVKPSPHLIGSSGAN